MVNSIRFLKAETVRVEKLGVEAGNKFTFDQVLLVSGDDVKVGNPTRLTVHQLKLQLLAMARPKKVNRLPSTREKPDIIKRMVIDSSIQSLRLTRSMHSEGIRYDKHYYLLQ